MKPLTVLIFMTLTPSSAVYAHDFADDIAKYNQIASAKKLDSKEAIAARVAYDALENEGVDSMKQALKLIETAPAK